jgi:hypothetical protein
MSRFAPHLRAHRRLALHGGRSGGLEVGQLARDLRLAGRSAQGIAQDREAAFSASRQRPSRAVIDICVMSAMLVDRFSPTAALT